jgi:sporulation protein YlmC with PRC-barrel domain
MLSIAKTLKGYQLHALDGEIGKVKEFYFDDIHWTVRYLVAKTGNWLTGRQVLISPYALGAVIQSEQDITVKLSKKQIEGSPSLDTDKPVSRQFEETFNQYYGWPMYWDGPYNWGAYPYIVRDRKNWNPTQGEKTWDAHLRSTHDVSGYHIHATDGEIGHVEDFVIDDETWAIRYLIVDTRNWWPGKRVLVSPQWIERVSWSDSKVFVNLSREAIRQSPEYRMESPPTREYETELHLHYDRLGYWLDEPAGEKYLARI